MSQYPPSYSPDPSYGGEQRVAKPSTVVTAVRLIWVNVALGVLSVLLTLLYLDDIVDRAIAASTVDISRGDARTAVVVVMAISIVLSVALAALWAYFIGRGANWARIVYTVLGLFGLMSSLRNLGDQPGVLVASSLLATLITIAVIVLLFLPESNAYFRKR